MAIKAYYRFNGNSNDSSGNGYNGVDTAITYGQAHGILNGGASFNGSSSKITVANNANFDIAAANFVFSLWVYPITMGANNSVIQIGDHSAGIKFFEIIIVQATGDFFIQLYNGSAYKLGPTNRGAGVTLNKWNHIVLCYDGSNVKKYLNAKIAAADEPYTALSSDWPTGQIMKMGHALDGGTYYYEQLKLDELKYEKGAYWTPAAIKNEYARVKGFF